MARSHARTALTNALASASVALFASLAPAQNANPTAPVKPLQPTPPPPAKPLEVKKCTIPGADPTGDLFLAALGKDGRREEFGPIAPTTAFEIWIEGNAPTKVTVQEPDPANPGQTHPVEHLKLPVSPVSIAEFDGYVANARTIGPVGNEGMFINMLVENLLEQRAMVLNYYDVLPGMKERLKRAADKIDKQTPFEKVIRQNSEDDQGKMSGGWFGNNVRGENLVRYPFEQVVFSLEPGDVVGPVFDKFMAYLMLCDKHSHPEDPHHPEQVLTRAVCSRYAVNLLGSKEFGKLMTQVRVRSDKDRFLRVLPPGAQVPPAKKFGPEAIAPIGKPAEPLPFRSPDDAIDGKARKDH